MENTYQEYILDSLADGDECLTQIKEYLDYADIRIDDNELKMLLDDMVKNQLIAIDTSWTNEKHEFPYRRTVKGTEAWKKIVWCDEVIFEKNVSIDKVVEFEQQQFSAFMESSLFDSLRQELEKQCLTCNVYVLHENTNPQTYFSSLRIDILDKNGSLVTKQSTKHCYLRLSDAICFVRFDRLIGSLLNKDRAFAKNVSTLIQEIKK